MIRLYSFCCIALILVLWLRPFDVEGFHGFSPDKESLCAYRVERLAELTKVRPVTWQLLIKRADQRKWIIDYCKFELGPYTIREQKLRYKVEIEVLTKSRD